MYRSIVLTFFNNLKSGTGQNPNNKVNVEYYFPFKVGGKTREFGTDQADEIVKYIKQIIN